MVILGAPSDDEDGMIKLGATIRGVKDSRLVSLEDFLVSLNSDSKGALFKSSLHLGDVHLVYHLVA